MATITPPRLMSAEEYEQLEEVPGFRDELIEGERVLSLVPILPHTAVAMVLERILENQLSGQPLEVLREAGWKLHNPVSGTDSMPIPDLMVVRKEDFQRGIKNYGWFEGVPLVIIEVISPSERPSRRLQKVGLYIEMGVPNVVEVDYKKRVIRVHTPGQTRPAEYRKGDQLTVPFQASVDEIFSVLD
jgi:Uma2 family endonuclease